MTRIIAGLAKGRRLAVPAGTRPTSDRAREGLFASVAASLGTLDGARVADLYAGSGAVGLEALSRGAAGALLVESDRTAALVIRANIETLGLAGAELVPGLVERVLERGPGPAGPRDFVFADPPYVVADGQVTTVLELLAGRGWLADGALVVIERATRSGPPGWPGGYEQDRSRRYGEATLWYGLAAGTQSAARSATGE
ncbi:MAG TPA: 16S rRNA (guanine(966)-N(2))-methyltransferase RsmD [Streptosporangiaceae bacterium]|jgi:16S rRNA (guanine966-N2)-methyltransferase